jgi:hypothetical protein
MDLLFAVAEELVSCCDLRDVRYDTCSRGLVGRSFPCDRASTHPFVDGPRTAKARPRSGLRFARHRLNQFDRPALLPAAHNQVDAWSLPTRSSLLLELAGSRRGSHAARRRTDTVAKSRWFVSVVIGGELHFCCLRAEDRSNGGNRLRAPRVRARRGMRARLPRFALVLCAASYSSLSLHALNPVGGLGDAPQVNTAFSPHAAWAHALSGEAKR